MDPRHDPEAVRGQQARVRQLGHGQALRQAGGLHRDAEPPQPDQRAERVAVAGGAEGGDDLLAGQGGGGDVAETLAHAVDGVAGREQQFAEPVQRIFHGSMLPSPTTWNSG